MKRKTLEILKGNSSKIIRCSITIGLAAAIGETLFRLTHYYNIDIIGGVKVGLLTAIVVAIICSIAVIALEKRFNK